LDRVISRRTADGFILSVESLIFNLKKQKHAASREMKRKCPNYAEILLGNVSKSSWRPFQKYLKGISDDLGNAQRVWKPFEQPLPNSRYTVGNVQIEVETRWVHFPVCLQPIGSKDAPRLIAHRVSAYIRHVLLISTKHGSFVKLD
jgi:hypothetical protein